MSLTKREKEEEAAKQPCFSPLIVCGLNNLGNTCYFNSGVQLLANSASFLYSLWDSPFLNPAMEKKATLLTSSGGKSTHALYKELGRLFNAMNGDSDRISPSNAIDALGNVNPTFEGRSQQDCAEMLCVILGSIEDEARLDIEVEGLLQSFKRDSETFRAGRASKANRQPEVEVSDSNGIDSSEKDGSPLSSRGGGLGGKEPLLRTPDEFSNRSRNTIFDGNNDTFCGAKTQYDFEVFKLMQAVNEENAVLERKSQERRNVPLMKRSPFRPPRIFCNSSTDGFKGYQLSEVTCHNCGATSKVVESFSTLLLDIPSHAQRVAFAKKHPEIERCLPNGQPMKKMRPKLERWWNPLCVLSYLAALFRHCFSSLNYPLTLDECLDIHFAPVELNGSNKYHCESCGQLSNATKSSSLLHLPEYILIQIKRFESGLCFDTKKTDPISFPISWESLTQEEVVQGEQDRKCKDGAQPEVLDLRHYVHPLLGEHVALPPSFFRQSRAKIVGSASGETHTSYSLEAIVSHNGSLGGGHYVSCAHKRSADKNAWLYISDDAMSGCTGEEVSNMEAYVLLYHKQPIVRPKKEEYELRDKARYYLALADGRDPNMVDSNKTALEQEDWVYISRMWLQKMAFFDTPGPIMNYNCFCNEEQLKQLPIQRSAFPSSVKVPEEVPHVHGPPVEWFYVPIEKRDFEIFFENFGGNMYVTKKEYENMVNRQNTFLRLLEKKNQTKQKLS